MKTHSLSIQLLHLDKYLICSAMGYIDIDPEKELIERVGILLQEACDISQPKCYFKIYDDITICESSVFVQGTMFNTDRIIAKLMNGSSCIAIFVATAGIEVQQWTHKIKAKDDCLDTFIADTIGSCIAEAAGDAMEPYLEKEVENLLHSNRFIPGYCGWDLEEQQKLFNLLPDNICGISLSEDYLMYPIKSISGIVGIGKTVRNKVYSCDICRKKECYQSRMKRNKELHSKI